MIIVAGESLIDMLPVETGGNRVFLPAPGGSPFNVAMALGRLGAPVRFLCRISNDPFGNLLTRTLEESRVDMSLCPRTNALSTLGFVMMEPGTTSPSYIFYTRDTAGCALQPGDLPASLPPDARCLHFGSVSLSTEPIGSTLEGFLKVRPPHVFVSVDPNIRPFLVAEPDRFRRRLAHFLAAANLIKISQEDLEWLHPSLSHHQCCEHYLNTGAELVVVTRGEKGALGMNRHGSIEVPAEPVEIADTVGAGDTFQAALLYWTQSHFSFRPGCLAGLTPNEVGQLLCFAAKAAAINCSRPGCNPPWLRELQRSV